MSRLWLRKDVIQTFCRNKFVWRNERTFVSRANSFGAEGAFLKWIREPGNGDISKNVNVQFVPNVGYDLVAIGDIPNSTTIVSIPQNVWGPYSADVATKQLEKDHPTLFHSILSTTNKLLPAQSRETSNLIRSCCISLQLLHHVQSRRSTYATFVSSVSYPWNLGAMPHPLLMNKEVLIDPYLGSTKLMSDITKRQSFYKLFISNLLQEGKTFQYLVENNFFAYSEDSPDPIDQYLWAIGLVLSRGLSSANSPLSLVPFIDFANHTNPLGTNCLHKFDQEQQSFKLITTRDIKASESLRISYGEARSTESFMVLYGFPGIDVHSSEITTGKQASNSKDLQTTLPVNPNDLFTMSVPINLVKGKSPIISGTISAEEFFEIFQKIPPLIIGEISEDIILLYEQIHVNLGRANATLSVPHTQSCDITFPMHLLTGLASIKTWNLGASKLPLPPSMDSEAHYTAQCVSVVVDVLLRSRKVAALVSGDIDAASTVTLTEQDIHDLLKDIETRVSQHVLTPAVKVAYGLTTSNNSSSSSTVSIAESTQALRHIVLETPLPADVPTLPADYYWRQSCAYYMHQQVHTLQLMEQECRRLLKQMEISL